MAGALDLDLDVPELATVRISNGGLEPEKVLVP
jgi:hypothetical protein